MSSVSAPVVPAFVYAPITPYSSLPYHNTSGCLTPLQLEGVGLAVNAFRKVYRKAKGGNTRGGFFLGDGAGVGKGRQISSVIRHAICTKKSRHLWLSVSRSLIDDTRRDLDDIGLLGVKLHSGDMLSSVNKGLGAR